MADVKQKFSNAGVEIVGISPLELAARLKIEMAQFGKLIKETGFRAE